MSQTYFTKEAAKVAGAGRGKLQGVGLSVVFHFFKQRAQRGGHGHGEAFALSSFWGRKSDGGRGAVQVDCAHRDLSFRKAAPSVQSNEERSEHPCRFGLKFAHAFRNFCVGERGLFAWLGLFEAHFPQRVMRNHPFANCLRKNVRENFQFKQDGVSDRRFPTFLFLAPSPLHVFFGSRVSDQCGGEFGFGQKQEHPVPAVAVAGDGGGRDARVGEELGNPVPAIRCGGLLGVCRDVFRCFKFGAKCLGFGGGVGIVPAKAGAFSHPFPVVFIGDVPVSRLVLFVETCHV